MGDFLEPAGRGNAFGESTKREKWRTKTAGSKNKALFYMALDIFKNFQISYDNFSVFELYNIFCQ